MIGLFVPGLGFLAGVAACALLHPLCRTLARGKSGDSAWRFRQLFERCPDALVAVDPNTGRIVEANAIARQRIGYDAHELARKTVADLIVPEELPEAMRNFAELAAGRIDAVNIERRLVCKDGRTVLTDCSVAAVKNAAGEVVLLIACMSDITDRKRIETQLRESETRLRTLIEQSPMGITFSRDGVTQDINAHGVRMFGYASAEELRETPVLQRIAPSHRAKTREIIESRRMGLPVPMDYETVGVRSDGREFPMFVWTQRIELADGPLTISFLQDVTERKKSEERIRHLAYFDQLTRLPNRELLHERLRQALSASAHGGGYGALLLLNLDNFKSVNDTRGHAAGDALLKEVAARLAAEVTERDTLARVDGDEFMVLLEALGPQPLTAASRAKSVGLKMMRALSGAYAFPGGEIHVGCSVGATILSGEQQTIQDLIRQVNVALHQAKKAGRNALRFFDPRMQENVNARASLESELRRAVNAGQFQLHYQVLVGKGGRAIGAEALLRWYHPERGMVAPGEFIDLAEETHLIVPIGQWVIDSACAQLAAWGQEARTRELSIAVNVSPLQFQQPDFAEQVLGSIRRHGADARRLELELTETLLQGDLERTVDTMRALKAQGVRFSLDDFGTGYSSLQYLRHLPLDQLKIDRSFVEDIADPNSKAIVGAILAMSRHLNLEVIAEGVETREQLAVLRGCGCTRYQGYLFGRPVPVEQLLEGREALSVG